VDGLTGDSNTNSVPDVAAIEAALANLNDPVGAGLSRSRCLRRWSEFIRLRDGHRCVDCHSPKHLSAHHISRKSFFAQAQFYTGNGLTLCRACHREAHRGFNGRPDLNLPIDAEGGEKLPLMERFYSILLDDAIERRLLCEDFYFLGDEVLSAFKKMQGYQSSDFPGSPLEQAYLILAETEQPLRNAIAEANGFTLGDQPMLPGSVALVLGDGRQSGDRITIRRYRPRSDE
jgi:hypothetical protein